MFKHCHCIKQWKAAGLADLGVLRPPRQIDHSDLKRVQRLSRRRGKWFRVSGSIPLDKGLWWWVHVACWRLRAQQHCIFVTGERDLETPWQHNVLFHICSFFCVNSDFYKPESQAEVEIEQRSVVRHWFWSCLSTEQLMEALKCIYNQVFYSHTATSIHWRGKI